MVGTAGFEPAHDWIKTSCLTAWPHPNKNMKVRVSTKNNENSRIKIDKIILFLSPYPIIMFEAENKVIYMLVMINFTKIKQKFCYFF